MATIDVRAGEPKPYGTLVRSSRFFKLHHDWYSMTREGTSLGPYMDLAQAMEAARDFIASITKSEAEGARHLRKGVSQ